MKIYQIRINVDYHVWEGGKDEKYISYCPSLDILAIGQNKKEAIEALKEIISLTLSIRQKRNSK